MWRTKKGRERKRKKQHKSIFLSSIPYDRSLVDWVYCVAQTCTCVTANVRKSKAAKKRRRETPNDLMFLMLSITNYEFVNTYITCISTLSCRTASITHSLLNAFGLCARRTVSYPFHRFRSAATFFSSYFRLYFTYSILYDRWHRQRVSSCCHLGSYVFLCTHCRLLHVQTTNAHSFFARCLLLFCLSHLLASLAHLTGLDSLIAYKRCLHIRNNVNW